MAETEQLLVPRKEYLIAGIQVGTTHRTRDMEDFVYKVNPTGLAILNIHRIDTRLKLAGALLAKYEPQDILVVSRRENGWKAVKQFAKATGVRIYTDRYPAGVLTNPGLETFTEPRIVMITDPWPDKNAVHDAITAGIPIIALCDSNNDMRNVDLLVPCNNKGAKSLGLIYWILANQYLHERGLLPKKKELEIPVKDFQE